MQSGSGDFFHKLGANAWLATAILAAEILNIIKMGQGEFTAPFPRSVTLAWTIAGCVLVVGMAVWQASLWISTYLRKASPSYKKVQ
jgi:hypothetical protein